MTANFQELFINDINSSIIKMDGNSLANASVIIYKIYRFRSLASRRKIIYKIYKISLAARAGDFKVTPTLLLPRKPPLLLRLRLFRMGYGSL